MNFPIQKLNSTLPVPISLLDDAFGISVCPGYAHRGGKRYSEGLYTCSHCRLPLAQQVMIDIIEKYTFATLTSKFNSGYVSDFISPSQAVASIAPCARELN